MKQIGIVRCLPFIGLGIVVLLLIAILTNGYAKVHAVEYTLSSPKLAEPLRLALVTDLHSARYGSGQNQLLRLLESYAPSAVLLGGDIFDSDASFRYAVEFLNAVGPAYPCYFVFGNHEYGTDKIDDIRTLLENAGVTILEGDCVSFSTGDADIVIAGVDDVRNHRSAYERNLAAVTKTLKGETRFCVLMSHEPQFIDDLLSSGADLIVSGHTHGGQWSVPGLINGVYVPGQGLFPKYAGGLYTFGEQAIVISRGLSKKPLCIPRIYTPRELVFLNLVPEI